MAVTLKDFCPINRWKEDVNGPEWVGRLGKKPKYLVDQTTGRRYWNESSGVVRTKCALLAVGTAPVYLLAAIVGVAGRVLELVTLSHFWKPIEGGKGYQLKARVKAAGNNLLHIVTTPFVVAGLIAGLELSAIFGVVGSPYNGRKMYATIERAKFGQGILARGFQPQPNPS